MKHLKSKFIIFNSILLLGFPFFYPLFQMSLLDVPSDRVFHFYKTFSFWIFCGIAQITGYAFHEMKRWNWNSFLVTSFLFTTSNILVLMKYSESQNKVVTFLVSLFLQAAWIYQVAREVKVPYFLPKIKWWQSNPRYKTSVKVEIHRVTLSNEMESKIIHIGEILDISLGGCFIKSRLDFNLNERILIRFSLFGEILDFYGDVVWRSTSTVTHPKGGGLKFEPLTKLQNKILKYVLKNLRKLNHIQNARDRMSPEEYERKMKLIQNTTFSNSSRRGNPQKNSKAS